jgi:Ca-activated chloride channel family protein
MTFVHPAALWTLVLLPLLALFEWRAVKRAERAARQLVGTRAGHALLAQQLPGSRRLGLALRLAAVALLITGAADPQWGHESVRRQSQGSDLVFAIDVSASMDTRDVPPSRIDEARREALGLLERVEGSRVGVVAFAGDAIRLCPLTLDHATARLTLETLSSGSVSTPGTDLGKALHTALRALPAGRRDEQAIVLWTDGEDLEGHAAGALAELKREGVRVFTVGVGTPSGDVIPVVDEAGQVIDMRKDESGQIVRSKLDENLLRDLARSTRGGYFSAARMGGELSRLAAAMGSLARSSHGSKLIERPVSRFPWFAALAMLLLLAEHARPRRRREGAPLRAAPAPAASKSATRAPLPAPLPASSASRVAALLLGVLALGTPAGVRAQSDWARGDAAFRRQQWARAESLYTARAKRGGAPAPLQVDLATSKARGAKREEGMRDLDRLTAMTGRVGQAAGYNLGTLLGDQGETQKSVDELRRALERDPNDKDARWNYELMRRRLEEQRKKQDQKQPPKPDPKKDQQPQQQPQQQPGKPQPQPPQPQGQGQQPKEDDGPPQGGAPGMTKQQAERLLGSLQELERLEKQRAKRTKVMQEKRGKDW